MSTLSLKTLATGEEQRWDRFVEGFTDATFFHKSGWRSVLEESLGHQTHYLYAERSGEIVGVLPLAHIKSRLFGNRLSSLAFCDQGGPAALDQNIENALIGAAKEKAEALGVDFLECRSAFKGAYDGWQQRSDLYASFQLALENDPALILAKLHRKRRAMVRKGISLGLESRLDEDVETLYRLFAETVRNLGTPALPKAYFRALKEAFGNDCEVLTILKNERPISAVLCFKFRETIMPYHAGARREARYLAANDFMYWEVVRRAVANNLKHFNFGRSKVASGSYNFKKNWGFEPGAMTYSYWLNKIEEVPDINPLNPKYKVFITLWKHLPLRLSKFIGPYIVRNLG